MTRFSSRKRRTRTRTASSGYTVAGRKRCPSRRRFATSSSRNTASPRNVSRSPPENCQFAEAARWSPGRTTLCPGVWPPVLTDNHPRRHLVLRLERPQLAAVHVDEPPPGGPRCARGVAAGATDDHPRRHLVLRLFGRGRQHVRGCGTRRRTALRPTEARPEKPAKRVAGEIE